MVFCSSESSLSERLIWYHCMCVYHKQSFLSASCIRLPFQVQSDLVAMLLLQVDCSAVGLIQVRRREIVGGGRRSSGKIFWIIGRWDPWAAARMAEKWRHPSLASDVHWKWPWNPTDNLKYGQIVIMLYAFLGRFGPNILFCQQLWSHNSANPPTVGHGKYQGWWT